MKARLLGFGEVDIDGKCYRHDVLIEQGTVRKRSKKPSKAYRERYGHTPLSVEERIPWGGTILYVGTGMYGSLPIMPEVIEEAGKRGVEVLADKTDVICGLLAACPSKEVNAILHITC